MLTLGILTLAIAPGIFWMWIIYRRDSLDPEPRKLVIRIFVIGMVSALPVMVLESPFLCCGLVLVIYAAPVIEELAKFFAVHQGVYYRREFDEPMDGIVYSAAAALGFATVENVFYIIQAYALENLALTAIIRAVLTVPGHALWSAMWGYAMGLAKFQDRETGRITMIKGLLLGMACHSLFNILAVATPLGGVGLILFIAFLWWQVDRYIKRALSRVDLRKSSPGQPPENPPHSDPD